MSVVMRTFGIPRVGVSSHDKGSSVLDRSKVSAGLVVHRVWVGQVRSPSAVVAVGRDSSSPAFLAWFREATVWQRIGRLVPLSWILILIWPLLLLLSRNLPPVELWASLLGLATFVLVWTWFWFQPSTGS